MTGADNKWGEREKNINDQKIKSNGEDSLEQITQDPNPSVSTL